MICNKARAEDCVLAAAIMIIALLILSCGIILNSVAKNDKKSYELRLLDYDSANYKAGD